MRRAFHDLKRMVALFGVCSTFPSLAEVSLPIVGWGAFPHRIASAERYREAKDAGFTYLTQWCDSPDNVGRLLSEADKAGVKLIIGIKEDVRKMMDLAEAFTAAAKDSPALGYYYIADEPHIREAEAIRDCVNRYAALDPAHSCYVNLYGAVCDLWNRRDEELQRKLTGCATYAEYIHRFYDMVPLKMISFDTYPVLSFKPLADSSLRLHGERVFLRERWYETLETTSSFARERKIPMFAFALATAHRHYPGHHYPAPTMAHLRLQHYSNLAYGAQTLQYFRCVNRSSLVYDRVREMNKELQARAYVFAGCEVVDVSHTGIDVPIGTKRLKKESLPPFVKSFSVPNGGTAVVSWLKTGEREYLVIVNRDPNDDMTFNAKFADGVEIVRRDGSRAKASTYSDTFWLDPGDTVIFAAPSKPHNL